jgi:hypothetical protein
MKLKSFPVLLLSLFIVIILFAQGCSKDDNPVQYSPSIEDQINAQRPLNTVVIYIGDPNNPAALFQRQTPYYDKDLLDASARDGYLTVKSSFGTWSYNLSQANYIRISSNQVDLDY